MDRVGLSCQTFKIFYGGGGASLIGEETLRSGVSEPVSTCTQAHRPHVPESITDVFKSSLDPTFGLHGRRKRRWEEKERLER